MVGLFIFRWGFLTIIFALAIGILPRIVAQYPKKETQILYAQNLRYVDPHITFDGSYVPGYYQGRGARNAVYFETKPLVLPMPQTTPGAVYFQLDPNLQPNSMAFSPLYPWTTGSQ